MTWVPNSSFYVTLMSHASTKEFPGNKSHHFRNRLPKPIRFMGRGWMVGMASLSLPTIPVLAEEGGVGDSHPLLYVRWHEHDFKIDDWGQDAWWYEEQEWTVKAQDMRKEMTSLTGVQFFHQLIYRYRQERAKRIKPKDKWVGPDGVKMYPTFEWTPEGDLLLNTKPVDYKTHVARVSWGRTLALKMGWIEQPSPGQYRLGPNLLPELDGMSTIPDPTDVPNFWKVEGDYLKLSLSCPWRFVNLNGTFRVPSEFPAVRPLHVYCDVGTSSMVGGRITDLLREIKYHPKETTHFEPRHIQYVPVRNEVVEIVETQMAETNGDLVTFGEGHTLLTLHFKREVVV